TELITEKSVANALRVLLAIGGSTKAIVHLTAIAGRAGVQIDLKKLNELSDSTPALVSLKPTGPYYISDSSAAARCRGLMRGRAVVFSSLDDLAARIDDPGLDVTPEDFLVLQNAGPKSGYAMPEAGYLPIPAKLARAGVKDMVRISDARMSGTAYGTIVLHVSPESAIGGPLALARNGDKIRLSVRERKIDLLLSADEIQRRKASWRLALALPARGYAKLYMDDVLQAKHVCDFDFLRKA